MRSVPVAAGNETHTKNVDFFCLFFLNKTEVFLGQKCFHSCILLNTVQLYTDSPRFRKIVKINRF